MGLFGALGVDPRNVVFSSDTSEEQGRQFGKGRGTVDCCYPVKCISGHYGELLFGQKQKLDVLFSPMIYTLPSFMSGHVARTLTCPRVMAAPENIKAGFIKERDVFAEAGIASATCYVMYYVGLSAKLGVNCIGLATSPTPAGPFTDQGPLDLAPSRGGGGGPGAMPLGCGDDNGKGNIDPSPFVDSSGHVYLYVSTDIGCTAGSCALKPTTSVIPLAADGQHASGGRVPLFSGDAGTWEDVGVAAPTVEGPSLDEHDGVYYLLYSGGSWQGAYGMGYATATSPTGPFTKSPANPILSATRTVLSPGGGDVVVTGPHGGLWLLYAARSWSNSATRTLRLEQFSWHPGSPDTPAINGPTSSPQSTQP